MLNTELLTELKSSKIEEPLFRGDGGSQVHIFTLQATFPTRILQSAHQGATLNLAASSPRSCLPLKALKPTGRQQNPGRTQIRVVKRFGFDFTVEFGVFLKKVTLSRKSWNRMGNIKMKLDQRFGKICHLYRLICQ